MGSVGASWTVIGPRPSLTEGAHFTDREAEVARMAAALRTPGAKLVVYGDRRLGKTSALERAAERRHLRSLLAELARRAHREFHVELGRIWESEVSKALDVV